MDVSDQHVGETSNIDQIDFYDTFPTAELSVLSLNAWGMPKTLGSKDKLIRMDAIGQHIKKGEHDVYLLQELWMRPDHAKIRSCIPPGKRS